MSRFRKPRLRKLLVILSLIAGPLAWQSSVADLMSFGPASHDHAGVMKTDSDQENHISVHDVSYHHCPNCAIHFIAIGTGFVNFEAPAVRVYEAVSRPAFSITSQAPPTPPPNS